MSISRRQFVKRVVVGLAGLPIARGVSWPQVKTRLGYMKTLDNAAMFIAAEKGFFKAEGLALEPVPMTGRVMIAQGMNSDDLQIGWSNVISLYQAHVDGYDFKLVSGGASNVKGANETHAIIVGKASPIIRAKDLEGKIVAVNTRHNIVHLMALAWMDRSGANSSKVKFVEVPFAQMESELLAGRVDAASIHEPFATAAVERGSARVLANPWGDVVPKFLISSWFASNKWIQKNKDVVEGFVRAINRGIDAMHSDPEETRHVMGKWVGLPQDMAGKVGWPLFEKAIAENDVQPTIDLTRRYTMIARSFKARQIISELAPRV